MRNVLAGTLLAAACIAAASCGGGGSNAPKACLTSCDDGFACTVDRCNGDTGFCESVPDDALCDDGNACTVNHCEFAKGCQYPAVPDRTACPGGVCLAGLCDAGARLDAVEPTGWASTEGGFNSNHAELRCGDDGRGTGLDYQHFPGLTFDLSSVPAGATVARAVLNLHQVRVDGDAPYGPDQREVVAEHVRYVNMWEADEVAAISGTIGQRVVSTGAAAGWRTADVTEAVAHELAASRTTVQLRLRFTPSAGNADGAIDWAIFASDDSPAPDDGLRPYLSVWYAP